MSSNNLNLPYFNNTSYPLAVQNQLNQLDYNEDEKKMLRFHQFYAREFFTKNPRTRGLLFVHATGTGKTRLAVAIAQQMRELEPRRKINVLLPKSLESNFRNTITSFGNKSNDYVDQNYRFISLNASNMFKQISNLNKSKSELKYEKQLDNFMLDAKRRNSLDNSLLIIDEAHNLFNAITNGASNATALYDLIISAKNIKLIFLTGTPIINDPFELVPCFNMLRGYMKVPKGDLSAIKGGSVNSNPFDEELDLRPRVIKGGTLLDESKTAASKKKSRGVKSARQRKTLGKTRSPLPSETLLFSENREEFEDFFIDRENRIIKNKKKFSNRIYGLASYYGDLYFASKTNKPGFPRQLDTIVEKIPMSKEQHAGYIVARTLEQDESKFGIKGKKARFSSSKGSNSTYRVKSRQISNYLIPEYALGPVRGAKSRKKFIHKITDVDLQNTDKFSPKMSKILSNITSAKHRNQLGMVYSQFVSGEGLAIFAKVLEVNGWENAASTTSAVGDSGYDLKTKVAPKYAILSGNISPEERSDLIKKFNLPENKSSQHIKLLLLSGAVAEGIDLKRIQHVHIMEPFWNYARIHQVIARAVRYQSHEDLPESEKYVQTYVYLSDYPRGYPDSKVTEQTTDIELYTKSINNMQIIDSFIQAIAESSIDCGVHYPKLSDEAKQLINCKLCSPNDKMLFHPLTTKDILLPNNCEPYTEKKVDVEEVLIPETDEKFYYRKDPTNGSIKVYGFNKKLNGYTPIPRSHRYYSNIVSKIILGDEANDMSLDL